MNLSTKLYFKHGLHGTDENSGKYFINALRELTNPDSEFGKQYEHLRKLPSSELQKLAPHFKQQGYDLMLAFLGENNPLIVGHAGFQYHESNPQWRMFSLYVKEEYRKQGLGTIITEKLIQQARDLGIRIIKLGNGNNEKMNRINKKLQVKQQELIISFYNPTELLVFN